MNYADYKDDLKLYQFKRIRQKYYSILIAELAISSTLSFRHRDFSGVLDNDVFSVSIDRMRRGMGMVAVNQTKKRVWDYVQSKTPAITIIQTGNNLEQILSAAKIKEGNEIMRYLDMAEYKSTLAEYKDIDDNMEPVLIDRDGLKELVYQLHRELKGNLTEYMENKKYRQMLSAKLLLEATESEPLLKQRGEFSKTGRLYLKGLNLQSIPTRVRSVALGEHYLYDFSTCAFGVLTSLYYKIAKESGFDPEPNTINLRGYVNQKTAWRISLTRDLYFNADTTGAVMQSSKDSVKSHFGYAILKEAFTAIGFGARATANCWRDDGKLKKTALLSIFRYQDKADAFLNHWFVKGMLKELKHVNDVIVEYYKQNHPDLEIIPGFKFEGRRNKSKVIAHIYQGYEADLCSRLIDVAGQENLALPLHDGIACYNPIGNDKLNNFRYELSQEFPFVKLDKKVRKGKLRSQDDYETERIAQEEELQAHRRRMGEAEAEASNYHNRYTVQEKTDVSIGTLKADHLIESIQLEHRRIEGLRDLE